MTGFAGCFRGLRDVCGWSLSDHPQNNCSGSAGLQGLRTVADSFPLFRAYMYVILHVYRGAIGNTPKPPQPPQARPLPSLKDVLRPARARRAGGVKTRRPRLGRGGRGLAPARIGSDGSRGEPGERQKLGLRPAPVPERRVRGDRGVDSALQCNGSRESIAMARRPGASMKGADT